MDWILPQHPNSKIQFPNFAITFIFPPCPALFKVETLCLSTSYIKKLIIWIDLQTSILNRRTISCSSIDKITHINVQYNLTHWQLVSGRQRGGFDLTGGHLLLKWRGRQGRMGEEGEIDLRRSDRHRWRDHFDNFGTTLRQLWDNFETTLR